jgi:HD-GYP domain-containing protein (c-di-GMP phosphodiesterase class II)
MATVRLADLLAGLSRLADLGFGLPAGESLRSSALAIVLGRSLDLPDDDIQAGVYTALMFHVGCVGYAHETVELFGDEFAASVAAQRTNLASARQVLTTLLPLLVQGRPRMQQARTALTAITRGHRFARAYDTAACEIGRDAARRLGLPESVQRSIFHSAEWWNGRGAPAGLAGDDIPVGARLAAVTAAASMFDSIGGPDLAAEAVRSRAGGILDADLARHFAARAAVLLRDVHAADPRDLVLSGEPGPAASVPESRLVDVATVFGDIADVKTPFTHGHSRGVAALCREGGQRLGLRGHDLADLEVAALLHDVGRVAVSNRVWEKPGRLDAHEWEQVRLHAYHSERILAASQRLAPLAPLVGRHHERDDGSGYHRGSARGELSLPAHLLAAADAYQAMTQHRPHRPALNPGQARQGLLDEARTGRLDRDAVGAVLAAAGHRAVVRRRRPAGLTDREVEVLALVAEGCTNAQIAGRLVISRRTAEQHLQNVYSKIGVSSRAAAAMFAMEHHLLPTRDQ